MGSLKLVCALARRSSAIKLHVIERRRKRQADWDWILNIHIYKMMKRVGTKNQRDQAKNVRWDSVCL